MLSTTQALKTKQQRRRLLLCCLSLFAQPGTDLHTKTNSHRITCTSHHRRTHHEPPSSQSKEHHALMTQSPTPPPPLPTPPRRRLPTRHITTTVRARARVLRPCVHSEGTVCR